MATVAVPGTTAGTTSETEPGERLGKQQQAKLQRGLPLEPSADPARVLAAARALALEQGWRLESEPKLAGGATLFAKTVDGKRLELSAAVVDYEGRRLVLILNQAG